MQRRTKTRHPDFPPRLKRGYIQLYVGEGFGKSLAAFGLAARMSSYRWEAYIARFWLGELRESDRIPALIPNITVEFFGAPGSGVLPSPEVRTHSADKGIAALKAALRGKKYSLVIGDALLDALEAGWVDDEDVKDLIRSRQPSTELVMTGRWAPDWLMDKADLVSNRVWTRPRNYDRVRALFM